MADSKLLGLSRSILASHKYSELTLATSAYTQMSQGSDQELHLKFVQSANSNASKQHDAMQNSNSSDTEILTNHKLIWNHEYQVARWNPALR